MIEENLHEFSVKEVEDVAARYRDYKILNSLYDYTDMLVMAKTADIVTPKLEYLFVDEAQDLSTLQWALVNRMAATTKHIVIAGDDKQSLNLFAGADVDTFLNVPGRVEVLSQSYRVPKLVFDQANVIVKHMTKYRKEGANWRPRKETGVLKRCTSFPTQVLYSGDCMVLARSSWQLEPIKEIIMKDDSGLLFTINGNPPVNMEIFRAIDLLKSVELSRLKVTALVALRDDDSLETRKMKLNYIKLFKKFISSKETEQPWVIDFDFAQKMAMPWYEAFDKVPMHVRRYIRTILPAYRKKREKLFEDVNIRLMTIHAAKGREADNVVVMLDVPRTVKNSIINDDSDTEAKTLYVAVTRAKKSLYLVGNKDTDRISLGKYLT